MFEANTTDSVQYLAGFAGILSAAIYAFGFIHSEIGVWRSFWKTLPVFLMAAIVWITGGSLILIIALVLCAIGDFFMSRHDGHFVSGLLAFLAGHVAFVVVFWGLIGEMQFSPALIIITLYTVSFGAYLWLQSGSYRVPVMAYIFVITAMAVVSIYLPEKYFLTTIGAFVFVLSDSILAVRMFVVKNPALRPALSMMVWITYIAGQAMIVTGLS